MWPIIKLVALRLYKSLKPKIWISVGGADICVPSSLVRSFADIRAILKFPSHEPEVITALESILDNKSTFIDIGANLGLYCIFVSKKFPECRIYGFEAIPETFSRLTSVLAANGVSNVDAVNAVVAESSGELLVAEYESGTSSELGAIAESKKSSNVKKIPMDSFGFDKSSNLVFLIDVDGFELDVLSGMKRILYEGCTVILEIHPVELLRREQDMFDVIKLLDSAGYEGRTLRYPIDRKRDHKQIHMIFTLRGPENV